MASGKTTLGRQAAAEKGWTFIDLDERVVEKWGQSIPAIFAEEGEAGFRAKEAEALRSLADLPKGNYVVACGGGTPCFHDNIVWMKAQGTVIYLRVSPTELANRLGKERSDRPLLLGLSDDELLPWIEAKLAEREPFYLQADQVIEGGLEE